MSEDIASKWNSRYAYSGSPVPPPAAVLSQGERWLPRREVGSEGSGVEGQRTEHLRALDLACGRGANAHWLAKHGFNVSAWDISEAVVEEIRQRWPQLIHDVSVRDVVSSPPEPASFDVIVVSRFLDRGLCPAIQSALKPGGVLYYQTFTHGLSNKDYLLKSGELPVLFSGLEVLAYDEPLPDSSGKAEASLVGRCPLHERG